MDTPIVNGTAYPFVKVGRKAYRFRILNACNDRMLNLQLYFAKSNTPDSVDASGNPTLQTNSGEVPMVPAAPSTIPTWPATWPKDGRDGGVPDPAARGPMMIQIGTEGGFIAVGDGAAEPPGRIRVLPPHRPVLEVSQKTLFLGPAERADVIVDFSQVASGTKLIMYNDAPAPVPAFDSRLDYFTGDGDQTDIGGAPDTLPGYGPNTRTVMQFQVGGPAAPAFNVAQLQTGLKNAYAASQDPPIVPQTYYESAFATTYATPRDTFRTQDQTVGFMPADGSVATVTMPFREKLVVEGFDLDYGRMNAQLGGVDPAIPLPTGIAADSAVLLQRPADGDRHEHDPRHEDRSAGRRDADLAPRRTRVSTRTPSTSTSGTSSCSAVSRSTGRSCRPTRTSEGWKDTIRVNPLVDTFVALRPMAPPNVPFKIGDSVRPLDPNLPLGATRSITVTDFGVPITFTFTNTMHNFGWEYVWHCHILGHEENDMMRPVVFQVGAVGAHDAGRRRRQSRPSRTRTR